jgi:hypothetical protein
MNAFDHFLTAAPERRCEACRHARATARDGLYCHRIAVSPYPCQVERASSTLEAWLCEACGRDGRYFEASAQAPAWLAAEAYARGTTRQEVKP